jgi:hypothetical protein
MRQALPVFALCCALTTAARADGNTGLVYGRVFIDGTSKASPCPVIVRLTSDRQAAQQTLTAADGSFHFLTVMPGRVTVTAGPVARELSVSANIANMDAYVRPMYLSSRRAVFSTTCNSR